MNWRRETMILRWPILLLTLLVWTITASAQTENMIGERVIRRKPLVAVAHRGGRKIAPENTLAALRAGMATRVNYLEIDVHQTLDSVVVLSHDETLDRCTDGTGRIDAQTFAEIRKVDAGSWFGPEFAGERIPTLEEAMDLVNGKCGLWIELKAGGDYPGIERRIVELIQRKQAHEWVEVISFDGEALRRVHALDSTIRLQKLMVSNLTLLPIYMDTGIHFGSPRKWDFVDGYCYFHRCAGRGIVRKVHRWGRRINVWTLNSRERLARFRRRGIDGFETDDPGALGY